MPKYYGCPCEGCGKPLTLQDDIVVCPDCGAPYHRVCYEKLGQCIHRPAHAAGYEWKFPYEESQLRTCPSCGERTLRDEETCRCCGAVLPPEGQEPPSSHGSDEETFDYSQMYRQFGTSADPEKEFFEDAFGKEAKMDGIDRQDWLDYIGPAAPAYLAAYSRMQLQKSKVSMSFSALLFGPFYFFYRKAWKPAFGFLAAELLLAAPTFIEMLQLSGSALAPAMSASALTVFARVCSVLSFVLMLVRGMYGKWLYRLVAVGRDSNTQVDHVKDDRVVIAPSLTYRPSTDTSLTLQALYQKDKSGSITQFFPWQGTRLPSPYGQIPTNTFISEPGWDKYDSENKSFGYLFSHRLNSQWTLRQNLRRTVSEVDYRTLYKHNVSFNILDPLNTAGTAGAHAIQSPIGNLTHTPHGFGISALLPYVMQWNKLACVERMRDIAEAMGVNVAGLSVNAAADQADLSRIIRGDDDAPAGFDGLHCAGDRPWNAS